jgi:hypoxanthine-DNA glycosylase
MRAVRLDGFPPIARPDARVLVLGTMPSAASLAAAEYYAHPRNAFWGIMGALFGFDARAPYAERCAALRAAGVAVWDVLAACRREGSLDTAIEADTVVVNDFAGFFGAHPAVARVFFNGGKAAELFRRHVPAAAVPTRVGERRQLPSTSPTNARLRFADKLEAWRVAAAAAGAGARPDAPSTAASSASSSWAGPAG